MRPKTECLVKNVSFLFKLKGFSLPISQLLGVSFTVILLFLDETEERTNLIKGIEPQCNIYNKLDVSFTLFDVYAAIGKSFFSFTLEVKFQSSFGAPFVAFLLDFLPINCRRDQMYLYLKIIKWMMMECIEDDAVKLSRLLYIEN